MNRTSIFTYPLALILALGCEDGFLCEPQPNCELPYFNDVWRYALPTSQ